MLEFVFQSLTRWLSGIKQSYYYQKKWYEGNYFSIVMCLVYYRWALATGNVWALLVISGLPIIYFLLYKAFKNNDEKKIHTLEYLGNYYFNFAAFFLGGDLLGLVFAIYVGDLLFNMPIQKHFTGNYLNKVSITNDPTGKTTNFYFMGKEYKMRNLFTNGYVKLGVAILCTIIYVTLWYFNIHLVITDIINFITVWGTKLISIFN
jgi:hypothetical protein